LTRFETLAQAVRAVSGPALLASISGWLGAPPGRLEPRDHGTQRIGAGDVEAIERSTRYFAATDAEVGGVLSREAAVGQLKYAVDLAPARLLQRVHRQPAAGCYRRAVRPGGLALPRFRNARPGAEVFYLRPKGSR